MPSARRRLAVAIALLGTAALDAQQQGAVRLTLRTSISVDGGTIHAAAFAPDGSALATGGENGDLRVLDLPARTVRWHVAPSDHWIGTLAFSPDGRRLACGGRHFTLHDAATGRELLRVPDAGPRGFAWRRDGSGFAYARGNDLCVDNGDGAAVLATFEYPVNALDFAADGALFVGDNVGRLWRVPKGGGVPELRIDHRHDENDMVRSVAVVCAGPILFDLASRGALRRGDQEFEVPGATWALATTADGGSFAVGGESATVRWWRDGGAQHDDFPVHGKVAALAFHPDGETLFASTYDGEQALHMRTAAASPVPPHRANIRGVALTPDGTIVAVRGRVWSLHPLDRHPVRTLPDAIDVLPGRRDAELLVSRRDQVALLDARNDVDLVSAPSSVSLFGGMALGPGNSLLVGNRLFDPAGPTIELDRELALGAPTVARAADGRWAVGTAGGIEGDMGSLVITDAAGHGPRKADSCPVYTVAFSPDGKRLFYGCGDGISVGMGPPLHFLRVRDVDTLALQEQVDAAVTWWRFLDDQRALACVAGKLQVWDVARLQPVQTMPLDGAIYGFDLSDDLHTLALATPTEVRVYRLDRN